MEVRRGRESDTGGGPSTKFLQARITALSTTLIKRLENIFAVALDENSPNASTDHHDEVPPSLTDTAVQQLQVDVESTALVRAAEEIMVLTRTMKEIWLFGGLNTIQHGSIEDKETNKKKSEAEMKELEPGFREFLEKHHRATVQGLKMEQEADQG